jgi:hypothetical protein
VLLAIVLVRLETTGEPRPEAVALATARRGWKTVEYRGVRFDIPSAWEPVETSDCEFRFPRWAPPDSPPCGRGGGVALYGSATFDPAHGPGVRRTTEKGAAAWAGYVRAGDYVVYASDADRGVVRIVLDSARAPH